MPPPQEATDGLSRVGFFCLSVLNFSFLIKDPFQSGFRVGYNSKIACLLIIFGEFGIGMILSSWS